MIRWSRHLPAAAVSAGPRELAQIHSPHPGVPQPTGPSADRTGQARRDAGYWQEVLRASGWAHGFVTYELWPLRLSQPSEDADAAAEDNGNSSALSERQAYRQYVCLFGHLYGVFISPLVHGKYDNPLVLLSPQSWHIMMSKSTSSRSECVHTAAVLLTQPTRDFPPSCPVICLSLSLPRIHLSSHIKRVKSLFREDCVQRYKELLASSRTWSRSGQVLGCPRALRSLDRALLGCVASTTFHRRRTVWLVRQPFTQGMKA